MGFGGFFRDVVCMGIRDVSVGAVCNVVSADFSQCVPAATVKAGVRVTAPDPLQETLGAAAPPLSGSGQVISDTAASCSSHPKCAGLKLAGDCCPNPAGATLDCCSNYQPSDLILEPTKATPATELEAAPPAGAGAGAGADWWKSRPSQEQCMLPEPQGCGSIRHKLMCLSRVDGRYGYQPHGIAVGGSPCVWCGGGPCTSYSDAVCEPQSWLKQGQGKAFATLNAATGWLVAKCQEDRNAVFDNLACLRRSENGCNKIQEKHQCLSSTDARPYVEVAGFKARDQPCVWCGGGICHSNNANLCEPYDFVMNGAGQAFSYNLGYNTYMVAECQGTEVMPMSYPHAEQDAGLPTQVRCTGATSTWNGVGKVCGDCSVTVPNIYVSFRSCGEYCAAQGGLRCLSAKKAFTHSCEVQSQYSMTCDSTFEQGEFGRCECGSGQASAEMVTRAARLPQMPYAQCGGQQWTGLTKCQSGSSCLVINSWYSQCLPGAQSNPDQAAQAAKNAAQAAGMDLEDQAKAAGEAATKAAASAGQQAQGQATRAYVAAAGTAAISGLPTPKASGIGEQAAQDAAAQAGLSGDEAAKTTEEAVKQGKVIVFGDEQTSEGAEIAGTAAANHAKDIGKTAEEQCVKAYGAAATFAEVSGKSLEQKAQLAAGVAARAAQRAGLAGEAQVRCVVAAAQENSKAHGEFADVTANTMHHAGVAAATEAGIDPTQVDTIVSVSIQETEHSGAQKVTIPQDVIDNCMAAGEAAVDGPSAAAMVATIAGKLRGMSAADTARAARKCVYDAAIAKGMTPEQAAAAAEAAASTAASAVMRPANNSRLPPHPLERAGEDCWTACGKKPWAKSACRWPDESGRVQLGDELNPTKECRDASGPKRDVNDVGHSVKEAVEYAKATGEAEKAVEETQAAGGGVESQVEAAGKAAAESVKEGGLNTADQVTSAYKSAEDAAKSAGMSAPEADAAAEKVSQEVAEAAGMTEQEAAAAAAAAAAVVHGRPLVKPTTAPQLPPQVAEEVPLKPPVVEPPAVPEAPEAATGETILPNPVPESIKEGIAAAETKKAENAPVHDQAVAAAGATGAYAVADKASQDTAKDQATKAAEYVAHKDGLPMDEAKSEAEKAVQEAITSQGGHFVEQPILPDPVPAPIQAGIEAARIEKAQDKPLHDQAVAAAGTTGSQAVAEKATQEAAKDQATKAAEYVAHQEGLPIDEAKSEAAKAVQEAIDSQGGHFVENPILPDPVPESIKAGIAAAEAEKAQAKPMHDQAVAAAGATGSYAVADKASQDIAKDQAAQAAEYIAHKDGLPLNEAKSEAVKAVQEAIAAQGGQFVENPILPHPVPEPIEAGIAAANAAKAEAKPTHDQAVAAAGATGSSAVADKATQEVAKDEATEAAEYISHQDGLPIHEAKTEATKAVQEAIDEQGGRFVVDHVDILPDPVPESIKAGIAAAEAEKAQAKPMHDQAVAAAGATGSYAVGDQATQEIARDQATKAAEYIAHKEGLPIKEAEDEAAKAVQEAINAQGGHFVENPILRSMRRAASLWRSPFCRTRCQSPSRRASLRQRLRKRKPSPRTTRR
ncbi:unnamed protein product [Effrenium voratum]|nr:unnamed protein product [Effrenium voratum]